MRKFLAPICMLHNKLAFFSKQRIIDIKNNLLTVGYKDEGALHQNEIIVTDWHWIGKKYKFPLSGRGQIRYRQTEEPLKINSVGDNQYQIKFKNKQFAVAAGQILAVYKGKKLIASATINWLTKSREISIIKAWIRQKLCLI